jgi:hypothetical protein
MVVSGATPPRDREESESCVGCYILVGLCAQPPRDLESHRTKVGADDFAASGRGYRRWTAVLGVHARKERAMGAKRACSRWESSSSKRLLRGGSTRRSSRRPACAHLEGLPTTSTGSATAPARQQGCRSCRIPKGRSGISSLPYRVHQDSTANLAPRLLDGFSAGLFY